MFNKLKNQKLKNILLVSALFAATPAICDTQANNSSNSGSSQNEKSQNPKVAEVDNISINYDKVLRTLLQRLQSSGMTSMPSKEQMAEMYLASREDVIDLVTTYVLFKGKALKNPEFLKEWLFTTMYLVQSEELKNIAKGLTDAQVKAAYDKMIAKMPVPMQYKLKVCVVQDAETANKILQALEANTPFEKLVEKYSVRKDFTGGNVLDPQTKNQFVSVFNQVLPPNVKMALRGYEKPSTSPTLIRQPVQVMDDKNQITYWVIQIDQIRAGSKNDMPKYDPKMRQQFEMVAATEIYKNKLADLRKQVNVQRFKPTGEKEDAPALNNTSNNNSKPSNA